MLNLVSGSMNAFVSIQTNLSSPSTTCPSSIVSLLNTLSPSHISNMLYNSSSQNIYHFERHSSSTQKTIYSYNKSSIPMNNTSHSFKPSSNPTNISPTSCTTKNATLNYLILLVVLSFDVTFFITNKSHPLISSLIKISSSSTFIMLSSTFHRWMFFSMISIKHTLQTNYQQTMTRLFAILTVSLSFFIKLLLICALYFRCCDRT